MTGGQPLVNEIRCLRRSEEPISTWRRSVMISEESIPEQLNAALEAGLFTNVVNCVVDHTLGSRLESLIPDVENPDPVGVTFRDPLGTCDRRRVLGWRAAGGPCNRPSVASDTGRQAGRTGLIPSTSRILLAGHATCLGWHPSMTVAEPIIHGFVLKEPILARMSGKY